MSSGFPYFVSPDAREMEKLRGKAIWAIVLGVLLILAGVASISYPLAGTVVSAIFFGVLLLIGGVLQIAGAVGARGWGGLFLHLLMGLLYLFVGYLFVDRPLISAVEWTLVLAIFFVAGGLVRLVSSLSLQFSGWGWSALNGLVTLVLGVLIWQQWPGTGLWVIGILVGIEMLFCGWSLVMLGLAVRSQTKLPG